MTDFDVRIIRDGHVQTLRLQAVDVAQARQQLQADGAQVISLKARCPLTLPRRRSTFALGLFIQERVVLLDARPGAAAAAILQLGQTLDKLVAKGKLDAAAREAALDRVLARLPPFATEFWSTPGIDPATLGFADVCAFLHALDMHRELVAQEFDTLLGGPTNGGCSGKGCNGKNGSSSRNAADDLKILRLELGGKPVMGAVGFSHDQQAGGVLVDAVHDARTPFATNPRQGIAAMVQQGVHQGARRRAGCGMHHHSGRFVDDDQIVVFPNDVQRNVFGQGLHLDRRGQT